MLIRSMGPEVIAADEIGSPEDVHAMEYAMHCGCRILATVHAGSMEELRRKPLLQQLVRKGSFERYVLLGNQNELARYRAYMMRGGAFCTGRNCPANRHVKAGRQSPDHRGYYAMGYGSGGTTAGAI